LIVTRILSELAGYAALLLWGLHMVQTGMLRGLGGRLRQILRLALGDRVRAFVSGIAVTALLQSSTATALMLAGFLDGGFVTLPMALASIFGANVGTTLIVQLLAFDISVVIPVLILAGVILFRRAARTRLRDFGRVFIGLGLILLALRLMTEALSPVEHSEALRDVLALLTRDPLFDLAAAALLTWAAHSSVAIVLLIMSLTPAVISLPAALALVLGANLGNTIPQLVAAQNNPAAKQLALGNLALRALGCAAALPFLPALSVWLTAALPNGAAAVAAFHTLFNLALAFLALPFLDPLARLCVQIAPVIPTKGEAEPRYISFSTPAALPAVALADAARETLRMTDAIASMLSTLKKALENNDRRLLREVALLDSTVDRLHNAIKLYLVEIGNQEDLEEEDRRRCWDILDFVINLEHAGDIADKSLREIVAKKIKYGLAFSDEGQAEITSMLDRVLDDLKLAVGVFMSGDEKNARLLLAEKVQIRDLERHLTASHLRRLRHQLPQSLETSSLHIDIARDLKRIMGHFASVAYPILEEKGALRRTRLID
jgi:phosphate:Na+ symporter